MSRKEIRIIVDAPARRIDTYLAEQVRELSRSQIRKMIETGLVRVDGRPVKPHSPLAPGQQVELQIPEKSEPILLPQELDIDIIYQDEEIIVVNKPAGLVVHPGAGHSDRTLVNALLGAGCVLSSAGDASRPGIVHRLDKETSGCLVVAKRDAAHASLSAQFKERAVKKEYLAITVGVPQRKRGTIDKPLGRHIRRRKEQAVRYDRGREAFTKYEVIEQFTGYALLRIIPLTGRTHQIRVHLKAEGVPVLCDSKYTRIKRVFASELAGGKRGKGEKPVLTRQALHASKLSFIHPTTDRTVTFEAALPRDILAVLHILCQHRL